jgi:hypothetical protein
MRETANYRRMHRAAEALTAGRYFEGNGKDEAVIDLVTDLFHYYARQVRRPMEALVRIARTHYEAERKPQTAPSYLRKTPAEPRPAHPLLWIVVHHHRHGEDLYPIYSSEKPPTEKHAERIVGDNFEADREDEYLDSRGPWDNVPIDPGS